MLSPKKLKFRKQFKGRIKGRAQTGAHIAFGEYAIQALEPGRITSRQIEAARIAMTRHIKRGGQVWIKVFPDTPVTKKPAEVRQGKGKGSVDHYVAKVKAGRILYEISGVDRTVATEALARAKAKLPIRSRIVVKSEDPWS